MFQTAESRGFLYIYFGVKVSSDPWLIHVGEKGGISTQEDLLLDTIGVI